jgi:hypothetical protein
MLQGSKSERKIVMGMAASQARFLGLTARKTNVEYEGQQINQQRTTLSNQSANYYNQLLGMQVPVPPSVADYTKTVYTFQDGALTNSISSMIAQSDGKYLISYVSSWVDDFAAVSAATSIVTRTKNEVSAIATDYKVGAKTLRSMSKTATVDELKAFRETYKDEYLNTLSDDQLKQLLDEENEYIEILKKQYGGTDSDWTVRYIQNTSTGTWGPYFTKLSVLSSPDTVYSDTGSSLSYIPMYTIGSAQKTEEVKGIQARFEQDATGRLISVTLKPGEEDQVTYAVTTNTLTDQAKYNDAMNQYEYDKYQYDQSIQEINAKIEIIQAEDKDLELRLKQLDTEQEAIQTEMDAVQKVIEKNTESTFKTFG